MAIISDAPSNAAHGEGRTLVTWGSTVGELQRRIAALGLEAAGVSVEVLDEPDGPHIEVAAHDRDRTAWALAVLRAGLGDVVVGEEGATLEGAVVDLLVRAGTTLTVLDRASGGQLVHRLRAVPGAARHLAAAPAVPGGAARSGAGGNDEGGDAGGAGPIVRLSPAEERGGATVEITSWLDGERRVERVGEPECTAHALDHLRLRLLAASRAHVVRR